MPKKSTNTIMPKSPNTMEGTVARLSVLRRINLVKAVSLAYSDKYIAAPSAMNIEKAIDKKRI
ncbi:hypothetical protein SDC9_158736 [bioreactor metagenome]|uniref:Uncharacterized protein n=1 Tax=bioreactor metagenome TaxID=1076179 RepID=A0A645FAN0_9ZZZZ